MKLKYQMRGLGIGIVVTAILMGVTTSHGIPLTDAEIRARALELGMVESNSLKLTDVGGMQTPQPGPDGEKGAGTGSDGQKPGSEEAGTGTDGQEPDAAEADTGSDGQKPGSEEAGTGMDGQEPDAAEADTGTESHVPEGSESDISEDISSYVAREGDKITVIIEPGTDSYTISEVLAAAGLVEDAEEFDNFLCSNLYSRKIVDGTYEIPAGASEEEIAKIITRQTE